MTMKTLCYTFSVLSLIITGCGDSGAAESVNTSDEPMETKSESPAKVKVEQDQEVNYETVKYPSELIPDGYLIYDRIGGDLNKDGIGDSVFILKKIDENNIVTNNYDEVVDRNRRGIMIFLNQNGLWNLTVKNMSCFSSENEEGGIYYPPQLTAVIKKGNLYLEYEHGRYGYWSYTFRLKDSDFELIGYDWSDNYGPIIQSETSINFLTKRKLFRENINQDTELGGNEIFEETWSDIELDVLLKLSEIVDFDELVVNQQ